jgi:hypothetical protein
MRVEQQSLLSVRTMLFFYLMLSQESKIADGQAKISFCKAWWFFRGEDIHQVCRGPEKTP